MSVAERVESFAAHVPALSRTALWCATRIAIHTRRRLHWRALRLATTLDYRAPVLASLGNGMKCRVSGIDEAGRAVCETGWYEPDTVRVLSSLLRAGDTFVDVGASFGQYALLAARIVGEAGRVFAFEPEPTSFAWLRDNVVRNALANVVVEPIALGECAETLDLHIGSPGNLGTTSFRRQYNFSGRTVAVPVRTLDDYCNEHGASRIDAIKLDVEGAEQLVLRGARKVLARRPKLIVEFEESNQRRFATSCDDLQRLLAGSGYELHTIGPGGTMLPYIGDEVRRMSTCNVLATPR